ncbi:MAG: indolepyruvate oxidoreductase subunit beta [Desulfobacterium sp.]|nr:indolepyruvate oxidoreductase subunit beta [Desulfobacterium sp.]
MIALNHDPYNLIITGVGGQGNVISSRMIGNMLAAKGFQVTIGETFGASQRGGAVMSHVRISSKATLSPQIPVHQAHMVVSLEPIETLRVLESYGNPDVGVICNTRPTHPIGVISGRLSYPSTKEIKETITRLSARSWFFDATAMATEIGNPIFANIIMAGALAATKELPLDRNVFEETLKSKFPPNKVGLNLTAYDQGVGIINTDNASH